MALSGTLQTLSLAEIFQTLERSKATGVLRLVSIEGGRDIVLISGNITNVHNRDAHAQVTVAQRLAASGIVENSALLDVGAGTGGYSIISNLRDNGVEEARITETIQSQLMDELFDVFTWEQANFEFLESNGQDEEVQFLVEDSQKSSVNINTSMVLMESARRLDEWQRARHEIPNDHVILSRVNGREQELDALAEEYPARAIIPLVNGARSMAEIIRESIATRLDIYLLLVDLLKQDLILILTTEQIIVNAQSFEKTGAFDQAAMLYRHALANAPDNSQLRFALAGTLEKQGDSPEAAECYAELAMGYLREGETGQACEAGRRAVEIGGSHFERNTYIQCLEAAGRIDDATEQMRHLAEYHADMQQWIEAKEICHQILTVIPTDEASLHVISLAFNHTCDLGLEEFEIACVHCSQVNTRDKINCENCSARLHKLCRNCHSETACSDSVCLYCGKSPHVLESKEQESGLYAQISEQDHKFRSSIQRAVDLRNSGDLDKSLAIWKEISQEVTGNQSVHNHIRELETEIHNQIIEKLIAKGNNYRRGRAFGRASKAYQEALRILSPRDARKSRLESILITCKKDNQRTRIVYAIAGFAVLVTSWIVAEPHIQYYQFEKDTQVACAEVQNIIRSGGGIESYKRVVAITSVLTTRGASLGERAQLNLVPTVTGVEDVARSTFSVEVIELIRSSLAGSDYTKAKQLIADYTVCFGAAYNKESLAPLQAELHQALEQQRLSQKLLDDAPKLYQEANDLFAAKKYDQALECYVSLSKTPDQAMAKQAQEKAGKLQKQKEQLFKVVNDAKALMSSDINAAHTQLQSIKADIEPWGKLEEWESLSAKTTALLAEASAKFQVVKSSTSVKDLEDFASQYPGTSEAAKAKDILKNIQNEAAAVDNAMVKIQQYHKSKDWEQLFLHGKRFMRDFNKQPDDLLLPLVIETLPEGVSVLVDGKEIGKTPTVYLYAPGAKSTITLQQDKFDSQTFPLSDVQSSYKLNAELNRTAIKEIPLRNSIHRLMSFGDKFLVVSKGAIRVLNEDGDSLASHAVGNLGLMEDNLDKWAQTVFVNKDYCLFANAANSLTLTDADGKLLKTHTLNGSIECPPLIYINELFGLDPRIAAADEGLVCGEIMGSLKLVQKEHQLIAGPVLAGDGFEQLLVFVSHTGQFVGFDEGNSKISWVQDSGAANVGKLSLVSPGYYLSTLDDSRLVLFKLDLDGVLKVWEKPLPQSMVATPLVQDQQIFLALKDEVVVYNEKGIKVLGIKPGREIVSVAGHSKAGIAIGCKDGIVQFYDHNAKLLWQHKLNTEPSALLVVENRVYIGTNKGQVIILAP